MKFFFLIKITPTNTLQFQILNLLNSFLGTGHDRSSATQNIKTLNTKKGQDAIIIR